MGQLGVKGMWKGLSEAGKFSVMYKTAVEEESGNSCTQ
jgi:hypothetical protein